MKQGYEIKPQFTNLFQLYLDVNFTRLIFGDAVQSDKEPSFHCAVVMTTKDAEQLANTILDLAKKNKEAEAAAGKATNETAL